MDASLPFTCLAVSAALYVLLWRLNPLYAIPTVGGSHVPILSYLAAQKFTRHAKEIIEEGYRKFHGSAFKVATPDRWMVVVSGANMIDDLRRRADDELSATEGNEEFLHTKYTIGTDVVAHRYLFEIVRERLTRSLPAIFPDVIDELMVAVREHIIPPNDEWASFNVMSTIQQVVARATNRAFVGLPVCRNTDYLDLMIESAMHVVKGADTINLYPDFLKPVIGSMLSSPKKTTARALCHLQPIIDERKTKVGQHDEDATNTPNDLLQWLLEEAARRKSSDASVAQKIVLTNFAAIHTTSSSITHALYDLATFPEYIQPLRDEIESVIAEDGWTKAAMDKLSNVDSFLKESQRYNGVSFTSLVRKAKKRVTLSDGTVIPKGTLVVAATFPAHHDEANYSVAHTFDPFRFARLREGDGSSTKGRLVTTSVDYLIFGHGKHACPGRFFAANELKALLAYIVLHYDLKLGGNGKRPQNIHYVNAVLPSPVGEVMFRKREVSAKA